VFGPNTCPYAGRIVDGACSSLFKEYENVVSDEKGLMAMTI